MAKPKIIEAIQRVAKELVQPDYTENDSASPAHIQNRPFYENDDLSVVTIDEKYIPDTIARVVDLSDFNTNIYVQEEEPVDAPEFSIWVDTNDTAVVLAAAEGVEF